MAAPTKLTPETVQRLTDAIRQGATYELACNYAGISYVTYRNWIKRAEEEMQRVDDNPRASIRQDEQPFIELFNAVKKAEGDAALKWLLLIDKAAQDGNWQAAAWKLERRYPQAYNKSAVEVSGKDGGPVEILATDYRQATRPLAPDNNDSD